MTEDDKAMEEAKRIMARLVNTPPQPHKSASENKNGKPRGRPPKAKT